jgi:hypothetical protein
MDIKDEFTTSSNEKLISLFRVDVLDGFTSNGGKDQSVTKEHPRELKCKRPNFMHGEPPSWTLIKSRMSREDSVKGEASKVRV